MAKNIPAETIQVQAEKLLKHAQAACRAELKGQHERQDQAELAIEMVLQPLLDGDSPRPLSDVLGRFFELCGEADALDAPADRVVDVLQELSACALTDPTPEVAAEEGAQLFAVSVLVPVVGRDWSQPLDPLTLDRLTQALLDEELLSDRHRVTWLPVAMPFPRVLELSEWSVSRLTAALARDDREQVQALIDSLDLQHRFDDDETAADLAEAQAGRQVMETRLLVGVAKGRWVGAFPQGERIALLLEAAEDEAQAEEITDRVRSRLCVLGNELARIFGVHEMQVCHEIRGWWQDTLAVHQLMRTVHAQQQLQALLANAGLELSEVLASSRLHAHTEEPIGMDISFFVKQDMQPLGVVRFAAMPQEAPEVCGEEALAFLHSQQVTVYDGAVEGLPEDDGEQSPDPGREDEDSLAPPAVRRVLH